MIKSPSCASHDKRDKKRSLFAAKGRQEKMENAVAEHSGKKARVKEEATEEASGTAIVAAAAATATATPTAEVVAVKFDKPLLDCPLCSFPLKPPVFQCAAGHTACGSCHAKLSISQCRTCIEAGAGAVPYDHNPVLDTFVVSAKIDCPNRSYGCASSFAYCKSGDHGRVCVHAPCSCPEPGCRFRGSPATLHGHLAAQHSWPVIKVTYGTVHLLHVRVAAERRRLLVAEGDDRGGVFFLSVGEPRNARVAVSVGLVTAAAAGPRYRCKIWTHGPVDQETGGKDTLMMEAEVTACAAPCEAHMDDERTVLTVPRNLLHGASSQMVLRVRLDKLGSPN